MRKLLVRKKFIESKPLAGLALFSVVILILLLGAGANPPTDDLRQSKYDQQFESTSNESHLRESPITPSIGWKLFKSDTPVFSFFFPPILSVNRNDIVRNGRHITLSQDRFESGLRFDVSVNPEYGVGAYYDRVYQLTELSSGHIRITNEDRYELNEANEYVQKDPFYKEHFTIRGYVNANDGNKYVFTGYFSRDDKGYEAEFERIISSFVIGDSVR